LGPTFVG